MIKYIKWLIRIPLMILAVPVGLFIILVIGICAFFATTMTWAFMTTHDDNAYNEVYLMYRTVAEMLKGAWECVRFPK